MNLVKPGGGWEHLIEIARIMGLDRAYTSNPCGGCHGIGCEVFKKGKCWAERFSKRLGWSNFKPRWITDEELERWKGVKKPAVITPVSMGDLFSQKPEHIRKVLDSVVSCRWHVFAILTKLPRYALDFNPYPENVWFGVTVNTQADVWRLDVLREIAASRKYCLFEPLYSAIDYDLSFLDLIVIGPQTHPLLQPRRDWVDSIVRRGGSAKIFYKSKLRPESLQERTP